MDEESKEMQQQEMNAIMGKASNKSQLSIL
jgi:hypothetical protein